MDIKRGLDQLQTCLAQRAPDRLADFHALEARFDRNENDELILGISENTRNERNQVMRALNALALRHCGVSFNALCEGEPLPPRPARDVDIETPKVHVDKGTQPYNPPLAKSFLDVEILIRQRRDAGYPVYVHVGDGRESQRGSLDTDILSWTASGDLEADGQRLFDKLLPAGSDPRSMWDRVLDQPRRIRLQIDTEVPELHAIPWELLHDGETFLAAADATPFSRYLPVDQPWGATVEKPMRVLAVIANPDDLPDKYNLASLDVSQERALLESAVGRYPSEHVQLAFLEPPATLERLEHKLRSVPDGASYHVLHFVGHGTFSQRHQQAGLFMQDTEGHTQVVTDDKLIAMLQRLRPQCPNLIYLAACQSAKRATSDALAGLGPKLVQAGVPAVVAMQDNIAITTARKMTPIFYEALLRHGVVDRALNAARSLLLTAGHTDAVVPVLFMRMPDGQLLVKEEGAAPVLQQAEASDIILSQRADNMEGETSRSRPALDGHAKERDNDSVDEKRVKKHELVDALLACDAMRDASTRAAIINDLPDDIKHGISHSSVDRVEVNNIVTRCLSFAGGIEELIELVRIYEGESIEMQKVDAVVLKIKGA